MPSLEEIIQNKDELNSKLVHYFQYTFLSQTTLAEMEQLCNRYIKEIYQKTYSIDVLLVGGDLKFEVVPYIHVQETEETEEIEE